MPKLNSSIKFEPTSAYTSVEFTDMGERGVMIEIDAPWAGSTESGFGQSLSVSITREQAIRARRMDQIVSGLKDPQALADVLNRAAGNDRVTGGSNFAPPIATITDPKTAELERAVIAASRNLSKAVDEFGISDPAYIAEEFQGMGDAVAALDAHLAPAPKCEPPDELEKQKLLNLRIAASNLGVRHKSGAKPEDYLRAFLPISRALGYATHDDSWGEFEKEFSIIVLRLIDAGAELECGRKIMNALLDTKTLNGMIFETARRLGKSSAKAAVEAARLWAKGDAE